MRRLHESECPYGVQQTMTVVPTITVEFFGIPRQRSGCAETVVRGETVAEVLAAIESSFPALRGLRRPNGGPAKHCLLSLHGHSFASDPQDPLGRGKCLLLLCTDAAG